MHLCMILLRILFCASFSASIIKLHELKQQKREQEKRVKSVSGDVNQKLFQLLEGESPHHKKRKRHKKR